MLYVVGPVGDGSNFVNKTPYYLMRSGYALPPEKKESFLARLSALSKQMLCVVDTHNSVVNKDEEICNIRWSLVSGGAYRAQGVSK